MECKVDLIIHTKDHREVGPEELLNLEQWLNFQAACKCWTELGLGIRFHISQPKEGES